MATKNAVYKVDNGDGTFDEIMFKTIEELIEGQKQRLFYGQGYRIFPGGLILQWGYVENITGTKQINFPIALKDNKYVVVCSATDGPNTVPAVKSFYRKTTNFMAQVSSKANIFWVVISFA